MNGLRFLMLILGLMMIVGQVRPDDETSEEDVDDENFLSGSNAAAAAGSSDSAEEDDDNNNNKGGIELYLSAMKDLYRQSKRHEAEPLVSSRSGASAPIAALYRRSALNKNFIRFGRSGGGVMKTDVSRQMQPIRLMGLNESDSGKDEERSFHPARPSRSLRSNFIRFGRSFFPTSNRWGETVRRSARRTPSAGRQMMSLVDLPASSSSSSRR
ncbi:putative FMRFamide perprohormone [Daphnia pulex]|uniref:Putative FMRFamide perprohormone n=1 Tax=Daphnia pulex TaxID=6669 RepID=E9HK97_DAPPU|nr:putative FMRFamide perprohormone [Daphnia pulex]|eukprot:EFX67846.1 putative FMRFamide perprohormone [Daphnia pulex]